MTPADPRNARGGPLAPSPWDDADARIAHHVGLVCLYALPLAAWLAAVWAWCVP